MITNDNYSIRRIENNSILKKSFLLFLDNFEKGINRVSNDILKGRINEAAAMFSINKKDSFEMVDVNFDDLKLIEIVSNYKEINRNLKLGQKLMFDGFELRLQNLVSVSPVSDKISIVKKLPCQFNLILGEGVLHVSFKAVTEKTYKKLKVELAA